MGNVINTAAAPAVMVLPVSNASIMLVIWPFLVCALTVPATPMMADQTPTAVSHAGMVRPVAPHGIVDAWSLQP